MFVEYLPLDVREFPHQLRFPLVSVSEFLFQKSVFGEYNLSSEHPHSLLDTLCRLTSIVFFLSRFVGEDLSVNVNFTVVSGHLSVSLVRPTSSVTLAKAPADEGIKSIGGKSSLPLSEMEGIVSESESGVMR